MTRFVTLAFPGECDVKIVCDENERLVVAYCRDRVISTWRYPIPELAIERYRQFTQDMIMEGYEIVDKLTGVADIIRYKKNKYKVLLIDNCGQKFAHVVNTYDGAIFALEMAI